MLSLLLELSSFGCDSISRISPATLALTWLFGLASSFAPSLSVLVAARFGGAMSAQDAPGACMDLLDRTGLAHYADRKAGALPLLNRKRLELARALATRPRVILLDEIAGGLTDAECTDLVATIRAIHAEGTAIIWIEHVLHALTSVVSRLMVLNFGQMLRIGTPEDVMVARDVQEIYLGIEA